MKLIIMGCCAAKRAGAAPMPALLRYDGPMWRTLRARLAELPAARKAMESGELAIWVLSARYGFVPASIEMPDYNLRMTPELARKMARDCSYDFQRIPHMVDDAEAALFAAGEAYRDVMWKASGSNLWNLMKVTETDGAGIGHHRAQLGAWLGQHFASDRRAARTTLNEGSGR